MTTVTFNVPNYDRLLGSALEETKIKALAKVEEVAKLNAPVDTGFYRNNIRTSLSDSEVRADAEYSAAIEYGVSGTARQPNPVMRNAAKKAQQFIKDEFLREFM